MPNLQPSRTTNHSSVRSGLFLLALAFATAPVNAGDYVSIPEGTTAFVHVNVESLRYTSEFSIAEKLLTHVDTEASIASVSTLGLDVTTLRDITVLVPPFTGDLNSQRPDFCASFRFSKSFRAGEVRSRLSDDWKAVQAGRDTIFVHADSTCLHLSSNKSLLIGSQQAVRWKMAQEETPESFLSSIYDDSIEYAHVICGVDLRDVPAEVISAVVPGNQLSFKPTYLALDVTLEDELLLDGYVFCDNNQQAVEATALMKSFVQMGIDFLVVAEEQHKTLVQSPVHSLQDTVQQLALIGVIREAIETLESSEAIDEDTIASLHTRLDKGLTYSASLAFMTALGAEANASLAPEAISDSDIEDIPELEQQPEKGVMDRLKSGSLPQQRSIR